MTASIRSPEDVINLALARIGYPMRVTNMFEGSKAANVALNIYGQTRDACLREANFDFAERTLVASSSGQSPPAQWGFSYIYPSDCLKIRNIFPPSYLADRNIPVPVLYTIANNATAGKVILANMSGVTLVYTSRITDPTLWEPLFIELFAVELSKRLALGLTTPDAEKVAMEEDKGAKAIATETIG